MKAGSRGSTDTRERFGMRRALVVAQVALSLVLVVGALLFVRSLRNLMTLDAGFKQDGILVAILDLRRTGVAEERRLALYQEIADRLASLPGVESAAQAFIVPVSGSGWNENIVIDGKKYKENVNFNRVSPGYFRTMGTPLLAGRDFDGRDRPGAEHSAIVTELFARTFFHGQDPIGRTFQLDEPPDGPRLLNRIVGVVKDTKYTDLREEFTPLVFFAAAQEEKPFPFVQVVMRSSAPLGVITGEVASAVRQANSNIIIQFQTLPGLIRESLVRERLMATLSGFFAALAAALAMIGLYGVMSYVVARRRNEIGIRLALGADPSGVVRMILGEAGVMLLVGLAAGALLAVFAARATATLLFGVQPWDPTTLASSAVALAVVGLAASWLPARRASRIAPAIALRAD
jgi:predicted permease